MEKKRPYLETIKLQVGKLTGKGKHTVKVENHPHTNMISKPAIVRKEEYKCRILEIHLKLRDQQFSIILYIYRLLYQNLMGTANKKSNINKKKESKHNTKYSHQITREENKRGREEKTCTKANPKQLNKWQKEHIYR